MEAPVLVTGAGGWIGAAVATRLRRQSGASSVVATDRSDLDCADPGRVREVLEEVRPAAVVHLAASTTKGEGPNEAAAQWRDTFGAGRILVETAARAGVGHLVAAGSIEELGAQAGVLHTDLAAQPLTTYGLCKSLVREVAAFEVRRTPILVDWFRPTTVYGPGQRGDMLVPSACAAARESRPADFTDGAQRRDFLYIDDLVEWIVLAVASRPGRDRGLRVHHLGTGVGVPVKAVLGLIAAGFPGARQNLGARKRRPQEPLVQVVPPYRDADPVLGAWRPRTSWRDGVLRTVAWWKSQPGVGASLRCQ